MPTLTANPLSDNENEALSDGKKKYTITNSDRNGQIHNSVLFAKNDQEAENKFQSSLLGARRKIIKVEEAKKHPPILYAGMIAKPLDSAQAA